MVKQNKFIIRNHNLQTETLSQLVKFSDTYTDELINSLSNKRENRRAKQTWEWEQVRRNSSILRKVT
jgi:hypothetical protein